MWIRNISHKTREDSTIQLGKSKRRLVMKTKKQKQPQRESESSWFATTSWKVCEVSQWIFQSIWERACAPLHPAIISLRTANTCDILTQHIRVISSRLQMNSSSLHREDEILQREKKSRLVARLSRREQFSIWIVGIHNSKLKTIKKNSHQFARKLPFARLNEFMTKIHFHLLSNWWVKNYDWNTFHFASSRLMKTLATPTNRL